MKKIFRAIMRYMKLTDKVLIFLCLSASGLGIFFLMGIVQEGWANDRQIIVQAGATALGLLAAIILSKLDYETMSKLYKLYLPVAYLLVLLTFFIGASREGADDKAWLYLPFGLSIQPTELLKIAFIMAFGYHLTKVGDHINQPKQLLFLCLHGAAPVLFVHFQGDDGTALVFAIIFASMLFAAGLSWRYVLAALGLAAVSLPILWIYVFNPDQKMRFLSIINPDLVPDSITLQQMLGKIAIGSGETWGNGVLSGSHQYVPEIANDFMFSFIGQAVGFVGSLLVIALLASICLKILFVGRISRDPLGRYLCTGVFATLATQTVINIGMCIGVVPVIGITLPFFSAGGSSASTLYLGIGLVLSVYVHRPTALFDK